MDALRDFSNELEAMKGYRVDYANWRRGCAKGAEDEAIQVVRRCQSAYRPAACQWMRYAEEPSDILCFRREYNAWRQGRAKGNRVSIECVSKANVAGAGLWQPLM